MTRCMGVLAASVLAGHPHLYSFSTCSMKRTSPPRRDHRLGVHLAVGCARRGGLCGPPPDLRDDAIAPEPARSCPPPAQRSMAADLLVNKGGKNRKPKAEVKRDGIDRRSPKITRRSRDGLRTSRDDSGQLGRSRSSLRDKLTARNLQKPLPGEMPGAAEPVEPIKGAGHPAATILPAAQEEVQAILWEGELGARKNRRVANRIPAKSQICRDEDPRGGGASGVTPDPKSLELRVRSALLVRFRPSLVSGFVFHYSVFVFCSAAPARKRGLVNVHDNATPICHRIRNVEHRAPCGAKLYHRRCIRARRRGLPRPRSDRAALLSTPQDTS